MIILAITHTRKKMGIKFIFLNLTLYSCDLPKDTDHVTAPKIRCGDYPGAPKPCRAGNGCGGFTESNRALLLALCLLWSPGCATNEPP